MSDQTNDEDDGFFDHGDLVYAKINPLVMGMVVGNSEYGSKLQVRLAASMTIMEFRDFELAHVYEEPEDSNVINFTKAAADLKTAKTKGAA